MPKMKGEWGGGEGANLVVFLVFRSKEQMQTTGVV